MSSSRAPRPARLQRKSFFVEQRALRRAKRALGVTTDAEAVRLSIERVVEMEAFWNMMFRTRGSVAADSFDTP